MRYILFTLTATFLFTAINAQTWNQYPYIPGGGTGLTFPADEGFHPSHPVEWWYTVGHVTGDSTGTEYSYMLTYFAFDTLLWDGFRIFNLANDETGEFYTDFAFVNYNTLSEDHLEIDAQKWLSTNETWVTKTDSFGELVPFEYAMQAQDMNSTGAIDLEYAALKRPLILDTTGFFNQGASSYTYYYSQSMLSVQGAMTINGLTENVTGTAWIDRQWGNFNPSTGEQYEWFCIQLDNGMDFNVWQIFDTEDMIPDTSTYRLVSIFMNDSTDVNTHDFVFDRIQYAYLPDSSNVYSKQWHLVYDDIDLTLTTLHNNSEVQLPFKFYEGTMEITGSVGGNPVSGVGFAELLHTYEVPQMQLNFPLENGGWVGSETISWDLLNPDGGREVYYDVDYSIDNKVTFIPIASNLTETQVDWDGGGNADGVDCWIRITGYSIDHTLINSYGMSDPFTFGEVGIREKQNTDHEVSIHPNPCSETLLNITLRSASASLAQITLQDPKGRVLINKMLNRTIPWGETIPLNLLDIPAGMYLIGLNWTDGSSTVRKIVVSD